MEQIRQKTLIALFLALALFTATMLLAGDKNHITIPVEPAPTIHPAPTPLPQAPAPVPIPSVAPIPNVTPATSGVIPIPPAPATAPAAPQPIPPVQSR